MHYWIDGYNLLFHLPKSKASFQEKRRLLIFEINHCVKELSLDATLVFDASDPMEECDTRSHYDCLEIIYTHSKKTADDAIIEAVELAKKPQNLCVVTADRDLLTKTKLLGAETLTLSEFFSLLQNKRKKRSSLYTEQEFKDSPREIKRLLKIFSDSFREKKQDD